MLAVAPGVRAGLLLGSDDLLRFNCAIAIHLRLVAHGRVFTRGLRRGHDLILDIAAV